jgi:glycosyltransferase involved in cell wall biosynthesis
MLSIITPVYNGEQFIEFCLKNVIEQDCPNIEHIIVDGGSTDKTVEIIKQYAELYPHIRWISEKDRGQSDAMNKGILMAKGEIIAVLNDDDFYEPNVLNSVSSIFKILPEPSFVVGNCNIWGDEGKIVKVNKPKHLKFIDLVSMIHPFPVNPSAYFYHRSLHQRVGLYEVEDHYTMDLDFILKAVQEASVYYIDETWGNYRNIQGTKTISSQGNIKSKGNYKMLIRKHRKKLNNLQQLQAIIGELILYRIRYFTEYPHDIIPSIKRKLIKANY